jgi:hypothetical protein
MPGERRYVYLWSLPNPAIVVPSATGIVYCNQTDGVATVHRELEGWLLPLPKCQAEVFEPHWWERHFNSRVSGDHEAWAQITQEIEAAVRSVASSGEAPTDLEVVPHRDNCEAWVHVSFLFPDLGPNADRQAFVPMNGVLTWENCD